MAVSTATTVDIASELETLLNGVDGLRVWRFVADSFRPPGAVIAMPSIDYADPDAGFCSATWTFGVSIIVARGSGGGERAAQDLLARLVSDVAQVLNDAVVDGWFSVDVLTATPTSIDVSGQSLPAYNLAVRVRA